MVTARVQNFDVENYGEAKVNGAVFIKLLDGTVIESSIQSFTLRDLIEQINGQIYRFTDAQLLALKAMCKQFQNAMKDWNIANIVNYTSPTASLYYVNEKKAVVADPFV